MIMLCDVCHEREATIHTTSNADEIQRNLCNDCFEASRPAEARNFAEALQTGCRYCGGEMYVGGCHLVAGVQSKWSSMCQSCAEEYFGFLRQAWPGFGEGLVTDEFLSRFAASDPNAVLVEVEAHMKKWVAENKSRK
jgi:protein-arginine kinase activator protein McsA